jgi:multidrug efflux pump subunit AcrA (membrane-fusion protein)
VEQHARAFTIALTDLESARRALAAQRGVILAQQREIDHLALQLARARHDLAHGEGH